MSASESDSTRRWIWVFGILFSMTILAIGLGLSLATGEWIALLCASGLVALPVGGVALRFRRSR